MRFVLFCCALLALPSLAGKEEARADRLAFLAGTWRGPMWGGEFTAYYTTPEGGRVLSHSSLARGGKEVFYEFELFDVRDGTLRLTPFPGGARKEVFRLAATEENKAVFENPKKDFPTRITYHRPEEGRLVITLSDPFGGGEEVETFDLKRVVE